MKHKTYIILFFLIFFTLKNITPVYSGVSQEELIFLPIKTETLDKFEKEFYEAVFIESLAKKNTVYSGPKVLEKIDKIGSSKQICTSKDCLRQVALEFNGSLIGQAKIEKDNQNLYTISFIVKDIFEDKTIYSKTSFCDNCNKADISQKIKTLFLKEEENVDAGVLNIETEPQKAIITIFSKNKEVKTEISPSLIKLRPDNYKVIIKKNKYIPYEQEVLIEKGKMKNITIELKQILGRILIISDEDGADVFINGEKKGTTPYKTKELPAGEYEIKAQTKNKYGYEKVLLEKNGETQKIQIKLKSKKEKIIKKERKDSDFNFNFGINGRLDFSYDFVKTGDERELITPFGTDLRMFVGQKNGINIGIGYFIGRATYDKINTNLSSNEYVSEGDIDKKEINFYLGKHIQNKNNSFYWYLSYTNEELTGKYKIENSNIRDEYETEVKGAGIGIGFWTVLNQKSCLGQSLSYGVDLKYLKYEYEKFKYKSKNSSEEHNIDISNEDEQNIFVLSIFTGIAF